MQDFWDQRFSEEGYAYGKAPNAFLQQELPKLSPGRILFPAEGQGRNAVFAASLGWQVYAFDPSTAGRASALDLAKERGVTINYTLADFEHFNAEPSSFDSIAFIYAHPPPGTRERCHRRLLAMLREGGTIILEGFSKGQLGRTSGGPQDPVMLFSEEELRSDFAAMRTLIVKSAEITLSEGKYHRGVASVVRLLGVK
jgi:SAM-dependent methyltransferase